MMTSIVRLNGYSSPVSGSLPASPISGSLPASTWWSQRFTGVLESFGLGSRLERGRDYARLGNVVELDVVSGAVHARVKGTHSEAYRVLIGVERLTDDEWARVCRTLSQRAMYLAQLLSGEMPEDIEEAFKGSRVSVFPKRSNDLQAMCNCPDDANPCKHIAAVLYVLAGAFNEDPFLVFAWRGRTREALIDELRQLRVDDSMDGEEEALFDGWPQFDPAPDVDAAAPNFWQSGDRLSDVSPQLRTSSVPDILLRQLDTPPIDTNDQSLVDALTPLYEQVAAAMNRRNR